MSAILKVECKSPDQISSKEKSIKAPCSLPSCLVMEVFHNLDPIQGQRKQNLILVCRQWAHIIVNGITVLTKKYTVAEAWDHLIGICVNKKSKDLMSKRKADIADLDEKGIEGYVGFKRIRDTILHEMATAKSFLIEELNKRRETRLDPDSSIESLTNLICEEEERIWSRYGADMQQKAKAYSKEIDQFQKNILFHFESYQALLTLANDLHAKMNRIQQLFIVDVRDQLHSKG